MLESKREMEAENGDTKMTEEIRSPIKRRKIHDSEIGELSENLLISGLADSEENSATLKLVMNGDLLCDDVKSTDLKVGEDSETVFSTFLNGEFSRETSPSGEILGKESEEPMDSLSSSTTKRKSSHRKCCVAKMPSTVEIDEFFSAAEKSEQERFAKKYNYDIVKDVPMDGRYEWIPLKSFN